MSAAIEDEKNHLRRSYLGKSGIHGVGISRTEQAIRVYVGEEAQAEQDSILDQFRNSAAPFRVIIIREGCPQVMRNAKQAVAVGDSSS